MPRKKHAYTLCIHQNDAFEEAYLYVMATSLKRHVVETMPWKNNLQRQDGQDDVEDVACSNTKKTTWKGACIHVGTTPGKRLFSIQMMSRNGRCMFSRQDDVAGEACSNVKMSPWKEDPIYSSDSMTEI